MQKLLSSFRVMIMMMETN